MEVKIPKAELYDYKDLCTIYKELDDYHRTNHPELFVKPEGSARELDYISGTMNDDNRNLIVAEADSRVVGFAECYVLKSSSFPVIRKRELVQLDNIAVKREY